MPVEIREITIKTEIDSGNDSQKGPSPQALQAFRAQILQEARRMLASLRARTVWRR